MTQIISKHLPHVSRGLLENVDKRTVFLNFLKNYDSHGLYALYDNNRRLWYIGKAADLKIRLSQHLKDNHRDSWSYLGIYILNSKASVSEIEALLINVTKPRGNKRNPKLSGDLRKDLLQQSIQSVAHDWGLSIFPERIATNTTNALIETKITTESLQTFTAIRGWQIRMSEALSVSQTRVSQLFNDDKKQLSRLIKYIVEKGAQDEVLALISAC